MPSLSHDAYIRQQLRSRRTRQARYVRGRIAYMINPAHVPDVYFAEWAVHLKDSVRRLTQLAREAEPGRGLKDVVWLRSCVGREQVRDRGRS